MKFSDIDACALKFKESRDDAFNALMVHYKPACQKWFRYVYYKTRAEKEEFYGKFALLLFRSLQRYNPDFKQVYEVAQSRFDRYFLAAVRKLAITYIRQAAIRSKSVRKVNIDDVKVTVSIDYFEDVYIEDIISLVKDPVDREIMRMRVYGNSREDVCDLLKLKLHQYRAHIKRIKENPAIVSLLTEV